MSRALIIFVCSSAFHDSPQEQQLYIENESGQDRRSKLQIYRKQGAAESKQTLPLFAPTLSWNKINKKPQNA